MSLDQQYRFFDPVHFLNGDLEAVYKYEQLTIGDPEKLLQTAATLARPNTAIIIGAQLGDEGKGAGVDRKIEEILKSLNVEMVYVVRYQGGSNAGHTVYSPDGQKVPLHQVPSGIMYTEAVGIMDSGMIINVADLRTEIEDAENIVGDLRGKLILSPDATLATDLERAEELLNRFKSEGNSDGGTGRGISPASAGRITRTGFSVGDLLAEDWEERFGRKYDLLESEIGSYWEFPLSLSEIEIPDLKLIRSGVNKGKFKIGTKHDYLDRLAEQREWLLGRNMVQNTFRIHHSAFNDPTKGILFEGSQAVGLHPFLGRFPDVTSTDTTAYGVNSTQIWRPEDIQDRIGIFKLTYQSSVGSAHMITHIDIPREALTPEQVAELNEDQLYAYNTREVAHEKGTTTGRYRDICYLDLELMRFNCRMGGIQQLGATHLDIANENTQIKVCTHYVDKNGQRIPYQPGLKYQQDLTPVFVTLPGWSSEAARSATCFEELPLNAQKFLAFVQRTLGVPITFVTNGPERSNLIEF